MARKFNYKDLDIQDYEYCKPVRNKTSKTKGHPKAETFRNFSHPSTSSFKMISLDCLQLNILCYNAKVAENLMRELEVLIPTLGGLYVYRNLAMVTAKKTQANDVLDAVWVALAATKLDVDVKKTSDLISIITEAANSELNQTISDIPTAPTSTPHFYPQ